MIQLSLPKKDPLRILCLGAHCDDIEIGCGGTLLKVFKNYQIEKVKWIVFSGNETRREEALASAHRFAGEVQSEITVLRFPDAHFSHKRMEIKEYFESLKTFGPSLIFTHYEHDKHQDHRLLNELTWNTFRNHMILEYEIPKYDGDIGNPTCYVPLSEKLVNQKTENLIKCFSSQIGKHWFDAETFRSLMRIRGMECASPRRYAEAFHVRKWTL
ncbi:MAG: PIG-L deacetylase family protein [Cyclobacteriaceae bacterium]